MDSSKEEMNLSEKVLNGLRKKGGKDINMNWNLLLFLLVRVSSDCI